MDSTYINNVVDGSGNIALQMPPQEWREIKFEVDIMNLRNPQEWLQVDINCTQNDLLEARSYRQLVDNCIATLQSSKYHLQQCTHDEAEQLAQFVSDFSRANTTDELDLGLHWCFKILEHFESTTRSPLFRKFCQELKAVIEGA